MLPTERLRLVLHSIMLIRWLCQRRFGGKPNQSAASSYSASDDGVLSVISVSVPNSQTASCWVVISNSGKLAFVSNTDSGTISSYRINAENGSLALLDAIAANTGI